MEATLATPLLTAWLTGLPGKKCTMAARPAAVPRPSTVRVTAAAAPAERPPEGGGGGGRKVAEGVGEGVALRVRVMLGETVLLGVKEGEGLGEMSDVEHTGSE